MIASGLEGKWLWAAAGLWLLGFFPALGDVLRFRADRLRRWPAGIRLAAWFLLLLPGLGLVWRRYAEPEARPPLSVLVDVSDSVRESRPPALKRWEDHWPSLRKKLARKYEIHVSSFGGDRTDLAAAIRSRRPHARGILLVSDGRHNAAGDPVEAAGRSGVPVWTVGLGPRQEGPQRRLVEVKGPEVLYEGLPARMDLIVQDTSGGSGRASVHLRQGGAILGRAEGRIGPEPGPISVEVTPRRAGSFTWLAEVEPAAGETDTEDNRMALSVDVVKPKVRVIYLCGQPSFEYSFLRRLLKSHPMLEVVSFVILRNPNNVALVPDHELSLIQFPVDEIFRQNLPEYDVFILENFTWGRFGIAPHYLENLRRFVEEDGKGLLMIGGRNSFAAGGWTGTPVEEALPAASAESQGFAERLVEVKPVDPRHPFFEGHSGFQAPLLFGYNPLRAKPGATILARSPSGEPLISVWTKGKGRAMAMAVNSTWRWAMEQAVKEGRREAYETFWTRAILWLANAPSLRPVRMLPGKKRFEPAEMARLNFRVTDEALRPVPRPRLRVFVKDPAGKEVPAVLLPSDAGAGEYSIAFAVSRAGRYSVRVHAETEEQGRLRPLGSAETWVEAKGQAAEAPGPVNADLLSRIATSSGGEFFPSPEEVDPDRIRLPVPSRPAVLSETSLWHSWAVLSFLLLALVADWALRRLTGLP